MRTVHRLRVPGDRGLVPPDSLLYQQLGLHDIVVARPGDLHQSLASSGNNSGKDVNIELQ